MDQYEIYYFVGNDYYSYALRLKSKYLRGEKQRLSNEGVVTKSDQEVDHSIRFLFGLCINPREPLRESFWNN